MMKMAAFFLVFIQWFIVLCICNECDFSWTDPSSKFTIPPNITNPFVSAKLSNYLFAIGGSSNSPSIYYSNLKHYTSLLSSLYDQSNINLKQFQSSLNNITSNSLQWKSSIASNSSQIIFPFTSYPSSFFTVEPQNDIYVVAPISLETWQTPKLWKLHIDMNPTTLIMNDNNNNDNDGITYSWSNLGALLYPLSYSCVVYDESSNISYIFGGYESNGKISNKVQSYNLTSNEWTALNTMNRPRRLPSCALDEKNNIINVFGGDIADDHGTIEQYNITSNEWLLLDETDVNFPFQRYATSAISLKNNDLQYIIGGFVLGQNPTTRIGVFNPLKSTLKICRNSNNTLPIARAGAPSITISDTILSFGGYTSTESSDIDDGGSMYFDQRIMIGFSHSQFINIDEQINRNQTDNDDDDNIISSTTGFSLFVFIIACIILLSILCMLIGVFYITKAKKISVCCKKQLMTDVERKLSVHMLEKDEFEPGSGPGNHGRGGGGGRGDIEMADVDSFTARRPSTTRQSSNTCTTSNKHKLTHSRLFMSGLWKTNKRNQAITPHSRTKTRSKSESIVVRWLTNDVGLPMYAETFIEHGFDRMAFVENLTVTDLLEMNITKPGHKKRILQQLQKYQRAMSYKTVNSPKSPKSPNITKSKSVGVTLTVNGNNSADDDDDDDTTTNPSSNDTNFVGSMLVQVGSGPNKDGNNSKTSNSTNDNDDDSLWKFMKKKKKHNKKRKKNKTLKKSQVRLHKRTQSTVKSPSTYCSDLSQTSLNHNIIDSNHGHQGTMIFHSNNSCKQLPDLLSHRQSSSMWTAKQFNSLSNINSNGTPRSKRNDSTNTYDDEFDSRCTSGHDDDADADDDDDGSYSATENTGTDYSFTRSESDSSYWSTSNESASNYDESNNNNNNKLDPLVEASRSPSASNTSCISGHSDLKINVACAQLPFGGDSLNTNSSNNSGSSGSGSSCSVTKGSNVDSMMSSNYSGDISIIARNIHMSPPVSLPAPSVGVCSSVDGLFDNPDEMDNHEGMKNIDFSTRRIPAFIKQTSV